MQRRHRRRVAQPRRGLADGARPRRRWRRCIEGIRRGLGFVIASSDDQAGEHTRGAPRRRDRQYARTREPASPHRRSVTSDRRDLIRLPISSAHATSVDAGVVLSRAAQGNAARAVPLRPLARPPSSVGRTPARVPTCPARGRRRPSSVQSYHRTAPCRRTRKVKNYKIVLFSIKFDRALTPGVDIEVGCSPHTPHTSRSATHELGRQPHR